MTITRQIIKQQIIKRHIIKQQIVYNNKFVPKGYAGITIWPFIFINTAYKHNDEVLNHEKIHYKQQIELLILPFFIIYGLHYVINMIKYNNHDKAYRNIIFEKEAYKYQNDFSYLKRRKMFACFRTK